MYRYKVDRMGCGGCAKSVTRAIAGIEPGVMLTVSGRVAYKRGLPVMFNPRYEIIPCSDR